ncbi:unnamed protein product, partial [Cercopithifilaria johnstoni]
MAKKAVSEHLSDIALKCPNLKNEKEETVRTKQQEELQLIIGHRNGNESEKYEDILKNDEVHDQLERRPPQIKDSIEEIFELSSLKLLSDQRSRKVNGMQPSISPSNVLTINWFQKREERVEDPSTTFTCALNYDEMNRESEHLKQESWNESYKSPSKEDKEEKVEVRGIKLQQIKVECSKNEMEKMEEMLNEFSQLPRMVRVGAESIKSEIKVSTTFFGGVKKSSGVDEILEKPSGIVNHEFWCNEKMDERLVEYNEDKGDESMKRSGEICMDQPHYEKFRENILDGPEILIKRKELYRFPNKEVYFKVSRTTKEEREVETRVEHKQTSEYPETTVKNEEEWNSKTQIESAAERPEVEVSATLSSEEIQDVVVNNDDDENYHQTFLGHPDLEEMEFEKIVKGIPERWPGNIKKTSENIAEEAGSLQKLQDFRLIHMEIKDAKGNEKESKINVEVISLNSKENCEDLSELSPSHAEGEMKHITVIYEWTQKEDIKDEEREWKVGKVGDTIDIKHMNKASSELDVDVEDADIPCKNPIKVERLVTKYDRAIENVAGEQYEMDENYPQDRWRQRSEVETAEERMTSRELKGSAETEDQMWLEEGKRGESSFFNDAEKSNSADKYLLTESSSHDITEIGRLTAAGWEKEKIPEKRIKELNGKDNGTEMDTAEILQITLEEYVEKEIYEKGEQQLSENEVPLKKKKGGKEERKNRAEVGKRPTGENVEDVVIRLKDGKATDRAKEVPEASDEHMMRIQTERILNEHLYTLDEKPVSKYFQEYNILGQKDFGPKKSTTFQQEIFVEQEKSIGILSLEATNGRSQERDAERIPVAEISSERESWEQKNMESENGRHETTITEKVHTESLELQNLKQTGLKPHEEVVLENVSMEYEQEAKTMQCEMSGIHSNLIRETARDEGLKQGGTVVNDNSEDGKTSQNGFFLFGKNAGIVSTSMIATSVALAAIGTAVAYEYTVKEHQETVTDSELANKILSIKKPEPIHEIELKESEISVSELKAEAEKTKPFKDIVPDKEILNEYSTAISKEPTAKREHIKVESWTESEEIFYQLSRTKEMEKTETKTFEDIIPAKEVLDEYGTVISKEPAVQEEHVTDMKTPAELEDVVSQLSRKELEETKTKPLEDIISVRKVLDEYGTEIFKEPTIERERLKTESWKEPEEVVDQLSRMEDLEETETKPLEDIISVRKVLDEYGTEIFDEPTIEREHFETESWKESEEAVNQLSRMEDLEETETKPLEDIISVRKVLDEYGTEIFKEPTIERERLKAESWKEPEEVVDQLSRMED